MDNGQNVTMKDGKIIGWNDPIIKSERSKTFQGIADAIANQYSK
jgi:hypothetical protein